MQRLITYTRIGKILLQIKYKISTLCIFVKNYALSLFIVNIHFIHKLDKND